MLEINANGKKIMTVSDNNNTLIFDKDVAIDIEKQSEAGKKPQYTLIETESNE